MPVRRPRPERCSKCNATLVVCDKCGHSWCLDHGPAGLACPGCGHHPSDDYPKIVNRAAGWDDFGNVYEDDYGVTHGRIDD